MNYREELELLEISDLRKALNDSTVDEYMYLKDIQSRHLYLDGMVDAYSAGDIVKNILRYNKEDALISPEERKPIIIYITSFGGSEDDGFAIIDAIKASRTPVYTVNMGYAYSMGFLIALAGAKRFTMPTAKFLMHDGEEYSHNSTAKVRDRMKFREKFEDKIRSYVLSCTKIDEDEYDTKYRTEWYMLADEAKDKGVVDYIINEDCPIDEVL